MKWIEADVELITPKELEDLYLEFHKTLYEMCGTESELVGFRKSWELTFRSLSEENLARLALGQTNLVEGANIVGQMLINEVVRRGFIGVKIKANGNR